MCEPGEPATIRRLSAPATFKRKPSLISPLISPAFSPEVTWQAAVQSPPGLDQCATPAKLWPATPLLDAYKLSSPMVLGPREVRKDLPEVLLLSPPGLYSEPKPSLVPLSEGLPFPSEDAERQRQQNESAANKIAKPKKSGKKGKEAKAPGAQDKPPKKKDPKERTSAGHQKETNSTGKTADVKEEIAEMPETSKFQPLTPEQANCSECSICRTQVQPLAEQSSCDPNNVLIDGRRVCEPCFRIFEPSQFKPKYKVCSNLLCRRKWKQLTPKVLTLFCPPCKRLLEGGIVEEDAPLEFEAVQLMYRKWYSIAAEMSQALSIPELVPSDLLRNEDSGEMETSAGGIQDRWRSLLMAFRESCPMSPKPEDVRNWNSVHGRKLYYHGAVHRGDRRFVCSVEASVELQEDLKTQKKIPGGPRDYHVIDWEERLQDGQEVHFLVFPNPSVNERDVANKLARLLVTPESDADEKAICAPEAVASEAVISGQRKLSVESSEVAVNNVKNKGSKKSLEATSESKQPAEPPAKGDDPAHKMQDIAASDKLQDIADSPEPLKISTAPASLQVPPASKDVQVMQDLGNSAPESEDSPTGENAFASLHSGFGDLGSFNDLMEWSEEFAEADMMATNSVALPEKAKCRFSEDSSEQQLPFPSKPPGNKNIAGILRPPTRSPSTNPASSTSPVSHSLPADSPQTFPASSPKVVTQKPGIRVGKAKPATVHRQSPLIAPKSPYATYFGD